MDDYRFTNLYEQEQDDEATKLYRSICRDDVKGCEALLQRGVNLNETIGCCSWTWLGGQFVLGNYPVLPLHAAVMRQRPRTVELLLKYGADPNKRDNFGRVPLYLAAWLLKTYWPRIPNRLIQHQIPTYVVQQLEQVILSLCSHGAQVDVVVKGEPLLPLVARYGFGGAVALLCRFGAPVQARDTMGLTPLHVAAQVGSLDVMRALLPRSEPTLLYAKDTQGRTALHYLCVHREQQVLKLLSFFLQRKVTTGKENMSSTRPILGDRKYFLRHKATTGNENTSSTRPILGARNIDIADAEGNTPLHIAAAHGNEGAIRMLLLAEANTAGRNHKGQTALFRLLDQPGNVKCAYGIELLYQETLHQDILDTSGNVPCLVREPDGPWAHLLPQMMCVSHQPPSLKRTCRHVIRRCIGLSNVNTSTVSQLPTAPGLKNTILFNVRDW